MNNLETLPQYYFDRDLFCEVFSKLDFIWYNIYPYESDDFKIWRFDEEWYFLHKPSGTLINYYKHCGRTNTCNKNLSLDEFEKFTDMLLEDILENEGR